MSCACCARRDVLCRACCTACTTQHVMTFSYTKMHGLDSVSWHDATSGIWALTSSSKTVQSGVPAKILRRPGNLEVGMLYSSPERCTSFATTAVRCQNCIHKNYDVQIQIYAANLPRCSKYPTMHTHAYNYHFIIWHMSIQTELLTFLSSVCMFWFIQVRHHMWQNKSARLVVKFWHIFCISFAQDHPKAPPVTQNASQNSSGGNKEIRGEFTSLFLEKKCTKCVDVYI